MVNLKVPNLMSAVVLTLFGGLGFILLGFLTNVVTGFVDGIFLGLGVIFATFGLLVVFLSLAKMGAFRDVSLINFIVLLAGISIVGGLVNLFIPEISFLILSTENAFASANSLLLVLTSLTVGQFVAKMVPGLR